MQAGGDRPISAEGARRARWAGLGLAIALVACEGGGDGAGAGSEDAGAVGEGATPAAGYFGGRGVSFRLREDGTIVDLDFAFACTCDGEVATLEGRIREGTTIEADGETLKPVVNHGAKLRIEGGFTTADRAEGTYDFQCCLGVSWAATRVNEAISQGGVCEGAPAGSPVPVGHTDSGATLHWRAPGTCIALSRTPALGAAGFDARLAVAAGAWAGVACSPLCFEEPVEAETGPSAADDRRIHFTEADAAHEVPPGALAVTRVRVRPLDGEITGATVVLGPETIAAAGVNELLRQFGRALGFDQAPEDVDSVLGASSHAERLTDADAAALCALYGDPPYCQD